MVFRAIVDLWFVFAPSAGYILQVQEMSQTRRTDGYSLEGSLILLVCNVLRVVYFFGEPFAVALLLQSFVTIAVQLALVLTVLKINVSHAVLAEELARMPAWVPSGSSFAHTPSILNAGGIPPMKSVENAGVATWTPRQFLLRFIMFFTAMFVMGLYLFWSMPGSPRLVGYLSMGVEATLVIPQLLLNRRRRSCEGLALPLVGNWVLGDVIKSIYFVVLAQPAPFLACAFTQLSLDGVLIYQLIIYRNAPGASAAAEKKADAGTSAGGGAAAAAAENDADPGDGAAVAVAAPVTEALLLRNPSASDVAVAAGAAGRGGTASGRRKQAGRSAQQRAAAGEAPGYGWAAAAPASSSSASAAVSIVVHADDAPDAAGHARRGSDEPLSPGTVSRRAAGGGGGPHSRRTSSGLRDSGGDSDFGFSLHHPSSNTSDPR